MGEWDKFDSFSLVYCLTFPVDLFIPQTFIGIGYLPRHQGPKGKQYI